MIKLLGPAPSGQVYIAYSGGIDSTAAWAFFAHTRPVTLAFFDHGTANSRCALEFIRDYHRVGDHDLVVGKISGTRPKEKSWEEWWREERYRFLSALNGTVVTGHHLDDAVETYVWRMAHGRSDVIPYRRSNCVRPFLLTRKNQLAELCQQRNYQWIEDASNQDLDYTRNHIRHRVIPELLKVNPGIYTVVKRKLVTAYQRNVAEKPQ